MTRDEKAFVVGRCYRLPVSTGLSRIDIPCEITKATRCKIHFRYVMRHTDGHRHFVEDSRRIRLTPDGCQEAYSPSLWSYVVPVRSDCCGIDTPTKLWEDVEREEKELR